MSLFKGTLWIIRVNSGYNTNKTVEALFQIIISFLNIFLFFNLRDGPSKITLIIHYCSTALEGTVLMVV